MSQLPPIHAHFEAPLKYIKHIQKFETNAFPTCVTVTKEWSLGRFNRQKRLLMIHHKPTCNFSVAAVSEQAGQLRFEQLDD